MTLSAGGGLAWLANATLAPSRCGGIDDVCAAAKSVTRMSFAGGSGAESASRGNEGSSRDLVISGEWRIA